MEIIPLKNKKWLTVRPAMPEDAAGLIAFSKIVGTETDFLSFGEEGWRVSEDEEADYIAAALYDERRCLLIGTVDDVIVGMIGIDPAGRGRTGNNGTLGIAIVKECWHLGIGSIFMVLAREFAQNAGYHKIELEVRADNARAISLYRRFGFEECGRRREHMLVEGTYHDMLVMELIF